MDLFNNIFKTKTTSIDNGAALAQVHSQNVLADKFDATGDKINSLDEDDFLDDNDTNTASRSAEKELNTTVASVGERGDGSLV